MRAGLVQSVEDQKRPKGLPFQRVRGNSSCLTALNWDSSSILFSWLWTWTESTGPSWVLNLQAFPGTVQSALLVLRPPDSDWNHGTDSPGSLACQLQILRTCQPPQVWADSLACGYVHINTHTYTYLIGSVSLENTASHTITWRVSNKDYISPFTKITKLLCWIKMKVSFQVNITFLQLYIFIMKTQCHVRNSLGFNRYFLHGNVTNFS